jgi:hypothetical protein
MTSSVEQLPNRTPRSPSVAAQEDTQPVKVLVLGHDHESVIASMGPDCTVRGGGQADLTGMGGTGLQVAVPGAERDRAVPLYVALKLRDRTRRGILHRYVAGRPTAGDRRNGKRPDRKLKACQHASSAR